MKKATGNMYHFVTHTWNPVRGECRYNCSYCYTGRWGKLPLLHIDERVIKEKLGENNFIFICSGCDLFHPDTPDEWIGRVIENTKKYNNKYLLHTKNPERALLWEKYVSDNYILCVTIETDLMFYYPPISKAPSPLNRLMFTEMWTGRKMITIEPVMCYTERFIEKIADCRPEQVNIGADSGNNKLPGPDAGEIEKLVSGLRKFTKVVIKKNLKRIYPGGDYEH
jgi:DNA repair photolyase